MDKNSERKRLKEIISVFAKHGMDEGLKGINDPVNIRLAMEDLGPTFIKIGQILSTRPDILSDEFIHEFQKLQDNVKPEDYTEIVSIIETELKGSIDDLFLTFDEKPIACASMAEVHLAKLKDGTSVVVKIQRPKAKETMFGDLAILKRLAKFMKFTPQSSVVNPNEILEELSDAVDKELDFVNESENIKKFYEYNKDIKYIKSPWVYKNYSTEHIIVMEYIDGIKIADTETLKNEGYDLDEIGRKLADNYFKQIFQDGFFHADPHPGNLLISDKKIAYIDFGMMGNLDKAIQDRFNELLYGVATRDIDMMTKSILKIGIKKGDVNPKKLHSDIEQIYNKYIDTALLDIDLSEMIDEVFKVCRENNIAMPRQVTMLFKGVMTIEGVVENIAPDINIMDVAFPYAKRHLFEKKDYKNDVYEYIESVYTSFKSGAKIPSRTLELINSALTGKLKIQMEHTNLDDAIGQLSRMINRVVFGMIVSAIIIGSSMVINADVGPKMFGISIFGFVGFIGAAIMGIWLIISILKSGRL